MAKKKDKEPVDPFGDEPKEELFKSGSADLSNQLIPKDTPTVKVEVEEEDILITQEQKDQIEARVAKELASVSKNHKVETEHKAWYRKNGVRRFRCIVTSNQDGVEDFDFFIPHPLNTDQPVRIHGKCGVVIEEGLNLYCINVLREAGSMLNTNATIDPLATMGLRHRSRKIKSYDVEILDEVQEPEAIGTIGHDGLVGVKPQLLSI